VALFLLGEDVWTSVARWSVSVDRLKVPGRSSSTSAGANGPIPARDKVRLTPSVVVTSSERSEGRSSTTASGSSADIPSVASAVNRSTRH